MSRNVGDLRVALSETFMDAFRRLPKKIAKRVSEAIKKFRSDPKSPGLNYESLATRDPNIRSIRAGDAYRIILVRPPKGNVYIFAWVDHHDEAYSWAKNRRIEVNPKMGAIQIYDETEIAITTPETAGNGSDRVVQPAGLFDRLDDTDLELCAVPAPLIPSVRAIFNDADLDLIAPHLPGECSDALYMIATGHTIEEAVDRIEELKTKVDVNDFDLAIDHPDSKRRLHVVADDRDLDTILAAPLEKWRVFLHPSQDRVVRMNAQGPMRVLGGAGTGKTVALMHRARHLTMNIFGRSGDVLVTTFTKNLARDIRSNLKQLCDDEFKRIKVVHLHLFCVRFLRERGITHKIVNDAEARDIWDEILFEHEDLALPSDFIADEWSKVVQANGLTTKMEYLKVKRVGRGTPLDRRKRSAVWSVMAEYRNELDGRGKVEWADIVRFTVEYLRAHPEDRPYRAILADEVQDLRPIELRLLRTLAPDEPNSLFLTGDAHQRIYGFRAKMSDVGIDIRGRSRRLKVNYRTTQRIRNQAVALLEGLQIDDLDGGLDDLKGYHSLRLGVAPKLCFENSAADEEKSIRKIIAGWLESFPPEQICLASRSHRELTRRYLPMLDAVGQGTTVVDTDGDDVAGKGIRLATMHRLKGLEYPCILVVGVHEGGIPKSFGLDLDSATLVELEEQERRLLYVAMTRARDQLAMTGYGQRSPFFSA